MKKLNPSVISVSAVIAALYVVFTVGFAPISFGPLQLRIAEALNLMAFINPVYGIGVTLGCFVSNMFSELGAIDMAVGTTATALAVTAISRTRSLFLASLWPVVFSGVMVGAELSYLFGTPLTFNIISVAAGQLLAVTCIGYPVFRYIMKNERLAAILSGKALFR